MSNEWQSVFIVHSEEPVRRALTSIMLKLDVHVTAFSCPDECLQALSIQQCHLVVIDEMPGCECTAFLREVEDLRPRTQVLLMTDLANTPSLFEVLGVGTSDLIDKRCDRDTFVTSVRKLLKKSRDLDALAGQTLTETEKRVLLLVVSGHSSKEIARQLGRSARTVDIHRQHIMRKTGASNVVDLVRHVITGGLDRQNVCRMTFDVASDSGPTRNRRLLRAMA